MNELINKIAYFDVRRKTRKLLRKPVRSVYGEASMGDRIYWKSKCSV